MNIAIPYRYDSNNGLELRFALRSIEKYFTGYKEVSIIGNRFPNWLTNVRTIHREENSLKTSKNILDKMITFFNSVHDTEVIQWQDDIYITQPMNCHALPYYAEGDLKTAIIRHHGTYKTLIVDTAMKVTDSIPYFDVHTPIKYEKHYLKKLLNYDWVTAKYIVKTLYCHEAKPIPTPYRDIKFGQPVSYEEAKSRIGQSPFFSTGPHSIGEGMIKLLTELYPNPSRYES